METKTHSNINKPYLVFVILLMFVLPMASILVEANTTILHICKTESASNFKNLFLIDLTGKWFLFWAIGLRLFTAGFRQVLKPGFTAETIFHIKNTESHIIVKELGFANICTGAIAIISLFIPSWRAASAFAGGLFMGIAGVNHAIKKPAGLNEWIAMISDIFASLIMFLYLIFQL